MIRRRLGQRGTSCSAPPLPELLHVAPVEVLLTLLEFGRETTPVREDLARRVLVQDVIDPTEPDRRAVVALLEQLLEAQALVLRLLGPGLGLPELAELRSERTMNSIGDMGFISDGRLAMGSKEAATRRDGTETRPSKVLILTGLAPTASHGRRKLQ
jgi:hypothetical protein